MVDIGKTFFEKLKNKDNWKNYKKNLIYSLAIILVSYILANVIVLFCLPPMLDTILQSKNSNQSLSFSEPKVTSTINYRNINKAIIQRNIFNDKGEFPTEKEDADQEKEVEVVVDFDINAPCSKTLLPLTLLGTIFLESGRSMASLREQGITSADIYAEGDYIIGQDEAKVARIMRNKVIINNKGRKECLEIDVGIKGLEDKLELEDDSDQVEEVSETDVQASWVESELGDGFGKIIQAARLVPNTVNNRVNGFKIFAIKKGSLLEKVGFENGDVIVQVNDTVMEAEQGFALYQSFLDDKKITVRVLRNGKIPKTLKVNIK